ncbi:hypothetical protein [Sulfitobacter aestuariivivens]|uniref:Uncharacterized protein n=1 Tax=Sulfitobacter aestuariivivens TaxID=2766981 RepID=A0A927HDI4_9RHOB|nr:hypothetical protein [Sulfitobacter aestuariivivens]MBD3662363.1 hypothetical protein [Sulfitobacter aestuariivivens]
MDAALVRLLILRLRGGVRLRLTQLASLRGALFLLAIGGIIWLLVVGGRSSPDLALFGDAIFDAQTVRENVDTFMPLGLLGMTLFTVLLTTGPSFHFSPNEINFLFVGPFSRRDLMVYKFTAYLAGAFLTAAIVTPFALEQTGTALSAFVATFLMLVFIQLNSAAAGMAWQAFGGNRRARMRRLAVAMLFTLAVAIAFSVWVVAGHSIFDSLADFRHSWIGTVILAPYIVFAQLFVPHPLFPNMIAWATLAVVINAALLQAIIKLDGRTTDSSLAENSRQNARWDRMKQDGSFWATERNEVRSLRHPPVLGGLGPIAWRQVINARRNAAKVVAVFVVIAACTGPLYSILELTVTDTRVLAVIYFFFTFIVPRTLICDFRGDLSRMEIYKTLPIAPWRICVSQLLVQVGLAYVIALTMIASILFFADGVTADIALILAIFALPISVLIYTVENTIFLLFPTKLVPMGRADFEFLGRAIVEFIVKTVIILGASLAAIGAGIFTFAKITNSWFHSGIISWMTMAIIGMLTTVALRYAYNRFAVAETFE